jgi:hypothetical protein
MQFDSSSLDHAFDPLKVVDIKTLASVADNLKKSKNKSRRAIGVFLDRVNRLRATEGGSSVSSGSGVGETSKPKIKKSDILESSGLTDLRD